MNDYPSEPTAARNTVDERLRLLAATASELHASVCSVASFTVGIDPEPYDVGVVELHSVDRRLDASIDVLQRAASLLDEVKRALGTEVYSARTSDLTSAVSARSRFG